MEKSIEASRAAEIRRLHGEIAGELQTTVEKAIRVGELLTEQKASMAHGEWLPWVEAEAGISARLAQEYMRMYEHRAALKSASLAHLADARRLLVAEEDQHDEFAVLWKRQEFTIPGSSMRIVWDGPDIKRRAKDDPYVPMHEYGQMLQAMNPVVMSSEDLALLGEWSKLILWWGQSLAEARFNIERRIGELYEAQS